MEHKLTIEDRPIFLLGFMGSGKTTVGKLLAEKLHWDFVDLDEEIVKRHGRHIKDIFEQNGEEFFRGVETAALRDIVRRKRTVIALGGGTFISHENRSLITTSGLSIFLSCPLETILTRIKDDHGRPLNRSEESLTKLFQQRLPIYQMAELSIDTDGLCAEDCVSSLLATVRQ